MDNLALIDELIEKGKAVYRTHDVVRAIPGIPSLNTSMFSAWKTSVLSFLSINLSPDSIYLTSFISEVKQGFKDSVSSGLGILRSLKSDLKQGLVNIPSKTGSNTWSSLLNIFDKFHKITRQLRNRYDSRETLDVKDEYDVQNLLHSLLHLYFDDIRPEEWTPSYAGQSNRMDFLLKEDKIVIEVKKTRKGLNDKELGNQLIIDIAHYKKHSDCESLICFVYDPEGRISNSTGIENDLGSKKDEFKVKVIIRP